VLEALDMDIAEISDEAKVGTCTVAKVVGHMHTTRRNMVHIRSGWTHHLLPRHLMLHITRSQAWLEAQSTEILPTPREKKKVQ
jgi:hypothetical protein